jgi:hypothetical protein
MTKYKIISTIRYLNVTDNLKESFSLMPGIELITERKTIKRILDKEFGKAAGMMQIIFCIAMLMNQFFQQTMIAMLH